MNITNIFQMLYNLDRSAVYCLLNESDKRIYIFYSRDICTSLSRNIRQLQDKTHVYKQMIKDIDKLEFRYIETIHYEDSRIDIDCKLAYYINYYKQLGYTVKHPQVSTFRVRIDVDIDKSKLVYVKLITRSYKEHVVGVFNNIKDATTFSSVFNNMDIITPVYSINSLTREYIVSNRLL